MNVIIQFVEEHKAAFTVAGAWAYRELHLLWPAIKPSVSFPWVRDNGGAFGVAKQFLFGKPAQNPTVNQNPKS